MEILNNYLFAPYVIEIYNFFKQRFDNKIIIGTDEKKSLQVFYGQPREAFRYNIKKFNGRVVLPMLNFYNSASSRILNKERFGTHFSSPESYDPITKTVSMMRTPMHFEITFSCNLWTSSNRERDYIIHELLQSMPAGEITLIHYPNTEIVNNQVVIKNKKEYLLMPLKLEPEINDETNIEQLEMPDVRDKIKTVFNIKAGAIVPYNVYRVPVMTSLEISTRIEGAPDDIEQFFPEK